MQRRRRMTGPGVDQSRSHGAIRVLVVDDHPVLLRGLVQVLTDETDIVVAATATGVADVVEQALAVAPDVIVLPWRLGGRAIGHELVGVLSSLSPARLIIYTGFIPGLDMPAQPVPGATLVAKTADPADLLSTIRGTNPTAPTTRLTEPLTRREREVLPLLLRGMSNTEIGELLTVELSTVKTHVRSVLRKVGATSRRDLIGRAARLRTH